MDKHAYLIIADSNIKQLNILVNLLDDSRNDIYIMIDKKSSLCKEKKIVAKFSNVFYLDPINIYWGGYSIVDAELKLFEKASEIGYSYYHLMSGKDLPIQNQDYIHHFFDNHKGYEFIEYEKSNLESIKDRIKPHFLRKFYNDGIRNNNSNIPKIIRLLISIYRHTETSVLKVLFNNKDFDKIKMASQWMSIDQKLVNLILENKSFIEGLFKKGKTVDEIFIPTLLSYYPEYLKYVFDTTEYTKSPMNPYSNLRYIRKDAVNAHPELLTEDNYSDIKDAIANGYLFARKFDINQDKKIIDEVVHIVDDNKNH